MGRGGPTEAERSRIRAALLAGAVGDALGSRLATGPDERPTAPAPPDRNAISAVTQLTLFTAEGLILAARAGALQRPSERLRHLHRAALRWLRTQGERSRSPSFERAREGWLLGVEGLQARRAPDATCLDALRARRMGRLEHPLNRSRGCGAIPRAAPIGLARAVDDPFRLGCRAAALTHGHPTATLAAGFFAFVMRALLDGLDLEEACREGLEELRRWPAHEACAEAVELAVGAERDDPAPAGVGRPDAGLAAEEALATALFCARAASNLPGGLRWAIDLGGEGGTAGALTGGLIGAARGEAAIPGDWLERLELRAEIEHVADTLHTECGRRPADRGEPTRS